jgi:predicted nucleic acid-binding Zn ribbon protein
VSDDDLVPLAASVDEVVRALKGPSAKAVAGVFAGWDDLVGPTVAAHARPVSLADGRLVVEVDEPGWATQLRYLEATLRERLATAIGGAEITAIDVRVRSR